MFKVNNGTTRTIFGICLKITESDFKTWFLFTSILMTMLLPLTHLNVKELLTRSRRQIWSLSDCKWTRKYIYIYIYILILSLYIFKYVHLQFKYIYLYFNIYIYLNLIFIHFNIYLNLIYITHIYKCFVYELSGCGFESSCVQ